MYEKPLTLNTYESFLPLITLSYTYSYQVVSAPDGYMASTSKNHITKIPDSLFTLFGTTCSCLKGSRREQILFKQLNLTLKVSIVQLRRQQAKLEAPNS